MVAPLDWGLGHATRCIPIIRELELLGATPILGGSGNSLQLLQQEFRTLESIELPDYQVSYPQGKNMAGHFIFEAPRLLRRIGLENQVLQSKIKEHQLDAVISDSRFGLWTNQVPTAFVSHQLWIRSPFLQGLVRYLNKQYIQRFGACWIPDFAENNNLAGALSHPSLEKPVCTYVGPLSRFKSGIATETQWDHIAIVSGPEPQRGKLEKLLNEQLSVLEGKHLMVCGIPGKRVERQVGNLKVVNHLTAVELEAAINQAAHVICRSGYSSLMDLAVLGKPALLIPTPGQTEQEYLAHLAMDQDHYHTVEQDQLDLSKDLEKSKALHGRKIEVDSLALRTHLKGWMDQFTPTA